MRSIPAPGLSSIEALAIGLFHDTMVDRSFMVMTGYFDESGTHGAESPLTTVAGFIASTTQWAAYERALSPLLSEFGIRVFHAIDFRRRKGDFKNWPTRKKAQFNSRFLRLADDHLSCGISIILRSDDYKSIYRSAMFPRKARPDTCYGLCFRFALLKSILYAHNLKLDWPLHVVMEDGAQNIGDAIRIFSEIKGDLAPEYSSALGFISLGSKKDCLPLAMADALAYAIFRMSAGYSKHPTEPDAAVVGPADPPYYVHKIPMSRTIIDEAALATLRDELCNPLLRLER